MEKTGFWICSLGISNLLLQYAETEKSEMTVERESKFVYGISSPAV